MRLVLRFSLAAGPRMKRLALIVLALHLQACAAAAQPPRLVADIQIGGEARWDYLTVDGPRHRLYVSHASAVEVIDTATDQVVGRIPDTDGVHGIAVAPELGLGFASDGKAAAVTVFRLDSLETVARVAVGANPDAIVYDPGSRRVLAFDGKSRDVAVIDAASGTVVATVPVGGKPEFAQLGADGHVRFNVEDTAELVEFDPRAARVVRRSPLAPCDSPSGLAVDAQGRYYAVCVNHQMVVAAADGRVLAHTPIGAGPDGVAWLDGAAWSANGKDGTLSLVRETAPGRFETVATFPTAPGARTIAADPATHRLYLPTATTAGAFHVLVLEDRP